MMRKRLLIGLAAPFIATASFAVVPPEAGPLRDKEFWHPDLQYENVFRPSSALPTELSRSLAPELAGLGIDPGNAYFDPRTGRWGTLIVTQPLIPGPGKGNELGWPAMGYEATPVGEELEQVAWMAFREYLVRHTTALRIDPAELGKPHVSVLAEGRLIQIHVGRLYEGIPVRRTYVKAAINSGNLVLVGQRNWDDLALETRPRIASAQAEESLRQHLGGVSVASYSKAAHLEIVPVSSQREATLEVLGDGLEHRLVWVLTPEFSGDPVGAWEALVDAHSGELLAFKDTTHYAARRLGGSIYPVSNEGVPPDGVLVDGFPLPFADIALDDEPLGFTSTGGNVPPGADTGTISTALSGRYLTMNDNCGPVDESAANGDLDLEGVPGGTDCQVPAGHSPGDTNATRSAFYEINRIQEQARGYLPGNDWLDQTLTANMNIDQNCNAGWNGSVNFFTSGGGCSNTGELAGVFDHEWGHGMDNNDGDPTISRPGEGIADIFAANRLNTSCMGHNFRPGIQCHGYGDPCIECTGVRDTDWAKRASGQPHDIAWIDANCGSGGGTPCGGSTHCEGAVYAEAVWDLVHRDFMGFDDSPWNLDLNTALELGTRLTYFGSSNVGDWFQCVADGTGGCNADSGYLGYLAADDDNGDLTDGTPHMSAIFAAFDRHQIACPTPTVQDAGCAAGPTTAPTNVTATPLNEGVHLSWDPVADASEYRIFRTEGVNGCDFGKTLVATTTDTQFVESDLGNDFEVLYSVAAVGDNDACASPMSACEAVTPEPGPGFSLDPGSLGFEETVGDGDGFFDNCENATLTFELSNTGEGDLTNVRIVEASLPSHPEASVFTELPSMIAASLAEGASAEGELTVLGGGFAFDDALELRVGVTSDQLEPIVLFETYALIALESDLEFTESVTFSYEEGLDDWKVVSGTFDRTDAGGGANGTDFYLASSTNVNLNCDRARSPLLQLTATSELELFNQFDIEPQADGFWWDRANVGVFEVNSDERTVVSPDGGRQYNAAGDNPAPAPCASHDPPQSPGWAGAAPAWEASMWSADALGSPELADQLVQIDVAYGTDPAVTGAFGLWFDEATLTEVFVQAPDAQADACVDLVAPEALAVDAKGNEVFEPGELVMVAPSWQNLNAVAGPLEGNGEDFSGPVSNALYTIEDGSADYGTIDPNEAASCEGTEDCYVLFVFDVSARPVSHWDASFDELTSPGVGKSWTLHLGDSFIDVPRSNLFYKSIETLLHSGVTGGCGDTLYCPAGGNTRAQMAIFLLRAVEGGDYTPPACEPGDTRFLDVPADSLFCPWIEELADRGIVSGCGGGNYCPSDAVSRAQMSIFLLKTLEGAAHEPPGCTEQFTDVPCPSLFADWIEDLAARGITGGCTATEYCPGDEVTRAQMATFITKTFGFTLYGP